MTVLEWMRVLNIVLAGVALVLMVWQRGVWLRLPPEWRIIALGCGCLVFASLTGSLENLLMRGPFGVRVPLTTVALAWLVWGLRRAHASIDGYGRRRTPRA